MFCLQPLRLFALCRRHAASCFNRFDRCGGQPAGRHLPASRKRVPEVAAVVTAYFHNSHADVIVSRLLQSMTLDGKGEYPSLKLVSLYVDQPPSSAVGLEIAKENHIPIYKTVTSALDAWGPHSRRRRRSVNR